MSWQGGHYTEIIEFWNKEIDKLNSDIKTFEGETTGTLVKELKEYHYISMEIGKLLDYATDTLCEKDLDKFIELAKERITKPKGWVF